MTDDELDAIEARIHHPLPGESLVLPAIENDRVLELVAEVRRLRGESHTLAIYEELQWPNDMRCDVCGGRAQCSRLAEPASIMFLCGYHKAQQAFWDRGGT